MIGRGSKFVVERPVEPTTPIAPQTEQARPERHRWRVLIIEDNVDAANSLKEVLEFHGNIVEVAYTGFDGLAKARGFGPEVVLCDIGLPQMDGCQVAKAFKADESLRAISLVALSGYELPEDVQRSVEAGFVRHLTKPSSMEALEKLLQELPRPGRAGTRP
jgi:CheY-like chemotaxis protein